MLDEPNTSVMVAAPSWPIHPAVDNLPTPMDIDIQNVQINSQRPQLESTDRRRPPHKATDRRALPNYDAQGHPKCFYCNMYGHVRKHCRSLLGNHTRTQNLRTLLHSFPTLFQTSDKRSKINLPVSHVIQTNNAGPVKMAFRRRSPKVIAHIEQAVQEMLLKGIIRPSNNEWVSEPHLVLQKDDGSYRFCIDFWPLNKITIHDRYPLPRVDDLLDQLGKSRYFTSLDLASGYWQIPLSPADAHKIAFRTSTGLYEFVRMPFGLSDAGSTFQRTANTIFSDLIQRGVLIIYLDDILVHTTTWSKQLKVLEEVLTRIRSYNLHLQLKKCKWNSTSLNFLDSLSLQQMVFVWIPVRSRRSANILHHLQPRIPKAFWAW
ncbi:hypothetical protein L7F22_037976 [Adiantum nelumboides]|nr:hypothetical protein [Adiantum nelumboides]